MLTTSPDTRTLICARTRERSHTCTPSMPGCVTRTKSACGSTTTSSRQAPLALPLCTIPAPPRLRSCLRGRLRSDTRACAVAARARPRAAVGADASAAQVHAAGTRHSHAQRGNHASTVASDATWRCRSSSTCGTSCGRSTRTATRRARPLRCPSCPLHRRAPRRILLRLLGVVVRFGGLRRSASCAPSWPRQMQRALELAHNEKLMLHTQARPAPRALPGTQGARHTRSTHGRLGLRRPVAPLCGSTTRGRRARRRPRTASGCVRRSSRLKARPRPRQYS